MIYVSKILETFPGYFWTISKIFCISCMSVSLSLSLLYIFQLVIYGGQLLRRLVLLVIKRNMIFLSVVDGADRFLSLKSLMFYIAIHIDFSFNRKGIHALIRHNTSQLSTGQHQWSVVIIGNHVTMRATCSCKSHVVRQQK